MKYVYHYCARIADIYLDGLLIQRYKLDNGNELTILRKELARDFIKNYPMYATEINYTKVTILSLTFLHEKEDDI